MATCRGTRFTVQTCISMTLTDEEQILQEPSRRKSTIIRHFEVGLDGVESIVRG